LCAGGHDWEGLLEEVGAGEELLGVEDGGVLAVGDAFFGFGGDGGGGSDFLGDAGACEVGTFYAIVVRLTGIHIGAILYVKVP